YDRKVMLSGERVNEGSAVTLCVGMGPGNEIVPIVSLRGLSLDQAIDKAHSASLNIGSINYDVQPNSELDKTLYVVYKQMPITGKEVSMGQPVTLFLTKDKKLLDTPEEVYIDSSAVQPKEDDLFAQ
ncbi:MAG TPA: PASTA domain-containing protein, partial [Paludibacteraceae bacterium]|nr:PASTA domain-containing protein [Paludibacteraceae bacterium]